MGRGSTESRSVCGLLIVTAGAKRRPGDTQGRARCAAMAGHGETRQPKERGHYEHGYGREEVRADGCPGTFRGDRPRLLAEPRAPVQRRHGEGRRGGTGPNGEDQDGDRASRVRVLDHPLLRSRAMPSRAEFTRSGEWTGWSSGSGSPACLQRRCAITPGRQRRRDAEGTPFSTRCFPLRFPVRSVLSQSSCRSGFGLAPRLCASHLPDAFQRLDYRLQSMEDKRLEPGPVHLACDADAASCRGGPLPQGAWGATVNCPRPTGAADPGCPRHVGRPAARGGRSGAAGQGCSRRRAMRSRWAWSTAGSRVKRVRPSVTGRQAWRPVSIPPRPWPRSQRYS